MSSALDVGMIGFGNIGAGVLRALARNGGLIDSRVPHPVRVTRIADLDTQTKRDAPYDPKILSADVDGLLADTSIHVVLELTGTIDAARGFMLRAFEAGKHVVTANKALMALHGRELIAKAMENEVCLLFEAAVAGGVPLIRTLHQGLAANDITAVRGIINGTANYILTRMGEEAESAGFSFETALREAQDLGYAEPDPTYDVEGHDTAHKLAILATLAFGQDVHFDDMYREGITSITALDIAYAAEIGYAIKLLGISKRSTGGAIEARVHPTLLPLHSRLASVGGVYNAVRIDGNLTGSVILSGRGAGPEPTSSSIISDLMALASGLAEGGLQREMRLCMPTQEKNVLPMGELETRYLIRLGMTDVAGALAQALTILGRHGVSIQAIKQPPGYAKDYACVMVTTHEARESQVQAALQEVRQLDINRADPFVMRIEDAG